MILYRNLKVGDLFIVVKDSSSGARSISAFIKVIVGETGSLAVNLTSARIDRNIGQDTEVSKLEHPQLISVTDDFGKQEIGLG